jgi:hypothetical protein
MDGTGNSFFQVLDCLSEYACAKIQSGLVRTTVKVAASPIGVTLLCHPERQRRVSGFFAPLRMTDGSKVVER